MSKRADRFRGILALVAVFSLLCAMGTGTALAAQGGASASPRILVLPFQVGGNQAAQAQSDAFVQSLGKRIAAKGLAVIPHETMTKLLETRRVSTLDVNTVRSLAAAAGATHAVYGSVNKIGDSVSVDARLVSADATYSTRPLFVEQRSTGDSILPSVEEVAGRVTSQFSKSGSIAGVEVRGTKVLDPDVVLMRINTRKGDAVDSEAIDKEIQRIWDLGYFS